MIRATIGLVSLPIAFMIPVVAFFQPVARADTLTPTESAYVQAYGGDVCSSLDKYHTVAGVIGAVRGVVNSGFTSAEAARVVVASVITYCPRNTQLLRDTIEQGQQGSRAI